LSVKGIWEKRPCILPGSPSLLDYTESCLASRQQWVDHPQFRKGARITLNQGIQEGEKSDGRWGSDSVNPRSLGGKRGVRYQRRKKEIDLNSNPSKWGNLAAHVASVSHMQKQRGKQEPEHLHAMLGIKTKRDDVQRTNHCGSFSTCMGSTQSP